MNVAAVLVLFTLLVAVNKTTALDAQPALLIEALQHAVAAATGPHRLRALLDRAYASERTDAAERCEAALAAWAAGLARRELWALQMLDATSKFVTGVLYGSLEDLGNFDECVAVDAKTSEAGDFSGRYALPTLDVQVIEGNSSSPSVSLRFALCVPSSCRPTELQAALEATPQIAGLRIRVHLDQRDTALAGIWREPDAADWAVIGFCVFLVLLVLVGTTVDICTCEGEGRERAAAILAFSAWSNGRRLLTPAPPSDSNFTCINGMRFMSALWVIVGHRYRYVLEVPFTNLSVVPKRVEEVPYMVFVGAPLAVDTFFTLGGLVNCYGFLRAVRARRSFNWLFYYVHRYVRLTPAFAVMIAVTATWLNLLGSGPLWTRFAASEGDRCRDYWWASLLYVSNYVSARYPCVLQSWYLMVDMQLHWLSPLLLLPLWKWGRAGLGWLAAVLLASCAVPFAVTFVNEFRSPLPSNFEDAAQFNFMRTMYLPTHTRFTSYVCGTLAGYILYHIKTGERQWKLNAVQVLAGWVLSLGLMATVLFAAQPLYDVENHPYNVWESSFYMGLYRVAWAAGLSWIVMACILGRGVRSCLVSDATDFAQAMCAGYVSH